MPSAPAPIFLLHSFTIWRSNKCILFLFGTSCWCMQILRRQSVQLFRISRGRFGVFRYIAQLQAMWSLPGQTQWKHAADSRRSHHRYIILPSGGESGRQAFRETASDRILQGNMQVKDRGVRRTTPGSDAEYLSSHTPPCSRNSINADRKSVV